MIVWNYRMSYENNLLGTDEMEQIPPALQNIIGVLLHLSLGLRPATHLGRRQTV